MSIQVPRLDGALCAETDPEMWFPPKGGPTKGALAICARCDAQTARLDFALATGERYGIWGGQVEHVREATAKERGIVAKPLFTYGGRLEVAERRATVRRLRAQGLDGPTIAERLGVSATLVYADFQALAASEHDLTEKPAMTQPVGA